MTAFLYIPARENRRYAQRVDFANIASLFVETDEAPLRSRGRPLLSAIMAALIVLIAIGDTVLITRPDVLSSCASVKPVLNPAALPGATL